MRTPGPLPRGNAPASIYVDALSGALREMDFYSAALDADMRYFIYLPPDYGTAGRRYPVLYMLHGAGGDKEEWPAYGLIDAADRAIDSGDLLPLIIVLPQGDVGYWADHAEGGPRWGEYVGRDLVRRIDTSYVISPGPTRAPSVAFPWAPGGHCIRHSRGRRSLGSSGRTAPRWGG